MDAALPPPNHAAATLAGRIRQAVIWRSGSQILAQLVQWAATFLVIRILQPADYGLYAMTGVVLAFLNLLNGYSLASGLVRAPTVTAHQIRQIFGLLLLLNAVLAAVQFAAAPLVADYYHQPAVATMLRVQCLLYLFTPFIALPAATLAREMDFARQARVNIAASVAGAAAALGGALSGWGVWTLVWAPLVLFGARAIGMTIAARGPVRPSFRFAGAGALVRYGGIATLAQLFWFAQVQADIVIAGRRFDAHAVGLYTTALFLTQIFQNKVVPPLNEVGFSAYARLGPEAGGTAGTIGRAWLGSATAILAAALPIYLGMAATAEPLVRVALGEHWAGAAPLVRALGCAMPFMTLYVLIPPATDALGRPGVGVRAAAIGALLLPVAYLFAVRWGPEGLAAVWLLTQPVMLWVLCVYALPVLGVTAREVATAIGPVVRAALAMALAVVLVDRVAVALPLIGRLALLVATGVAVYGGWLLTFARPTIDALVALVRRR